jgi:hypothetical protein
LEAIRVVTARIRKRLQPRDFLPERKTIYIDALGHHIDDQYGMLDLFNEQGRHPLLSAIEVVDGAGNVLVLDTDYRLNPRGVTPIFKLRRLDGTSWSDYSDEWVEAIAVTGIFGYHSDYAHAWLSSGDTVQNSPLSSSATTITINDADGADGLNRIPRFSPGQLLQIDSEWLELIAVDANTLTVTRGARGATAVAHNQNAPIRIFQVEGPINRAAVRWAAYLYARRGAFESVRVEGMATVEFPEDMPGEVRDILDLYAGKNWSTP